MSNRFDDLVNSWIIDKFIEEHRDEVEFYGPKDQMKVVSADMGWDCSCYSDYTRDDHFVMKAVISVWSNEETSFDVVLAYGLWEDLPSFIEELEEYESNEECPYWIED